MLGLKEKGCRRINQSLKGPAKMLDHTRVIMLIKKMFNMEGLIQMVMLGVPYGYLNHE